MINIMVAPTAEVLKSCITYEEIPQVRIQVTNEEAVNKNIIVKSVDEYHSAIWDLENEEANAGYWIIEPTGEIQNVTPSGESVFVEDTYAEGYPPEDNKSLSTVSTRSMRFGSPRIEEEVTYSNQFKWSEFDLEPTKDRIRIWHCNRDTNLGTLVDPSSYQIVSKSKVTDSLLITSNFDMNEEDYYLVEYLPWRYSKVYEENRNNQQESSASQLVDLFGKVNRPLDGTYAFYLDGVRLDRNMARFVSPTKLIFVKPNTALFSVYERSHDVDIYGIINMTNKSLEDQLMDIDSEFLKYMEAKALE